MTINLSEFSSTMLSWLKLYEEEVDTALFQTEVNRCCGKGLFESKDQAINVLLDLSAFASTHGFANDQSQPQIVIAEKIKELSEVKELVKEGRAKRTQEPLIPEEPKQKKPRIDQPVAQKAGSAPKALQERVVKKQPEPTKEPISRASQAPVSIDQAWEDAFQAFAAPYMRRFTQEIGPGIAEKYSGYNAGRGSGFQNAIQNASAGLEESLRSQFAQQFGIDEFGNIYRL